MVIYNIQTNGPCSQLVIELLNDAVFVEPSAVAYVAGDISLNADISEISSKFKAHFIGKKFFKPTFKGTGKIYLNSTLGTYHKFTLKDNEELIIANKYFIACRDSMQIVPELRISLKNFLSGSPMLHTLIKGTGSIMVLMAGPVVEQTLKNEKFVAYNNDVAAYSKEITVTRELAGKGTLNIANKMVRVYRGTGKLFFVPNPNKDAKRSK